MHIFGQNIQAKILFIKSHKESDTVMSVCNASSRVNSEKDAPGPPSVVPTTQPRCVYSRVKPLFVMIIIVLCAVIHFYVFLQLKQNEQWEMLLVLTLSPSTMREKFACRRPPSFLAFEPFTVMMRVREVKIVPRLSHPYTLYCLFGKQAVVSCALADLLSIC